MCPPSQSSSYGIKVQSIPCAVSFPHTSFAMRYFVNTPLLRTVLASDLYLSPSGSRGLEGRCSDAESWGFLHFSRRRTPPRTPPPPPQHTTLAKKSKRCTEVQSTMSVMSNYLSISGFAAELLSRRHDSQNPAADVA